MSKREQVHSLWTLSCLVLSCLVFGVLSCLVFGVVNGSPTPNVTVARHSL